MLWAQVLMNFFFQEAKFWIFLYAIIYSNEWSDINCSESEEAWASCSVDGWIWNIWYFLFNLRLLFTSLISIFTCTNTLYEFLSSISSVLDRFFLYFYLSLMVRFLGIKLWFGVSDLFSSFKWSEPALAVNANWCPWIKGW